jgi:hypothetical protein
VLQGDPYKTLFLSRLSYEVTERKLRHEFEEYGPIKRIRLVQDLDKGEWRDAAADAATAACAGVLLGTGTCLERYMGGCWRLGGNRAGLPGQG